ncbi:ATP-binding protein [Roseateles sp. MS654]|uniref:ATP-binding protein n=1 Tax=Roseateles sp. MS654 TaxID=3412685 RepID=UPI003C303765
MSGTQAADDANDTADVSSFFEGIAWTPVIQEMAELLVLWISCDLCGAALWGLPRVGKSEFARYIEKVALELFGDTMLVIRLHFEGSEQFVKTVPLIRRMLANVDVRALSHRDPDVLRQRFYDEIWSRCTTKTRRILVIVDEVQNVAVGLYGEFSIINAAIRDKEYTPFMLSIGQPELRSTVANVENKLHTMGRMFQEVCEFHGLSLNQLEELLASMEGKDLNFSRRYFPARAEKGWSVIVLVGPIERAVRSVVDLDQKNLDLFMPMAIVRQTLNYLFFFLADEDNADKDVTETEVLQAFARNGFKKQIMAYCKPRLEPAQPKKAAEQ